MSGRGHFVGRIIDDLDAIASQVKARCALGQTDLNRVLEDFFKELLNLVHGANLRNLNKERSNEPGLDLGDWTSPRKIAFQVTSQADAAKINRTLDKITKDQRATYDEIYVLVIGRRQKTYSLDAALVAKCGFNESRIIGITELCRDIMDLDLPSIRAVHDKLAEEQRRIRIELEPEIDGKFATTVLDLIETKPNVQRSDGSLLAAHAATEGLFDEPEEAADALNGFIDELQKLPRLTREFFGWLIDHSDQAMGFEDSGLSINADYLAAMRKDVDGLKADVRLLDAWGFLDFEQDESHKSGWFNLYLPGSKRTNLREALTYFILQEKLSATTMFSTMNFTPFGPTPAPRVKTARPRKLRTRDGAKAR